MSINTILILEDDYTMAEYLADDIKYYIAPLSINIKVFYSIDSIDHYLKDSFLNWSNVCCIIDLNMNPYGLETSDGNKMTIDLNHYKFTGWIWLYSKYNGIWKNDAPTVKIYSAYIERLRKVCEESNLENLPEGKALTDIASLLSNPKIKTYKKGDKNSLNRMLNDIRSLVHGTK